MLSFSNMQILERHINDCFETNDKQMPKMAKNDETLKLKKFSFESIFVQKNNAKQNPDQSYRIKY